MYDVWGIFWCFLWTHRDVIVPPGWRVMRKSPFWSKSTIATKWNILVMREYTCIKFIHKLNTKTNAHTVRFSYKMNNQSINRNSLNNLNFCGIAYVSQAISKYSLIYEQVSNTYQIIHLLKLWCTLHACRQLECTCTFALLCSIKGFPTYFKRSDSCGEIILSCSRKFLSNANLRRDERPKRFWQNFLKLWYVFHYDLKLVFMQ